MADETGYYALLDTVKFDARTTGPESLALNAAEASACMIGNLLVGGINPVLSQNQVFDNGYLLDLVGDFGSPDSKALLRLAQEGVVRARILERGSRAAAGRPFTIVDAFAGQLANASFHLSAWPELVDTEARQTVSRVVLGESKDRLPAPLSSRVEALLALDRAFRQSADDERAVPLRGLSLQGLVRRDLDAQTGPRALIEMWRGVRAFLVERAEGKGYDLRYRGQWRAALSDFATRQGIDQDHPMILRLSGFVDLHYHRIIGASVGAGRTIDSTTTPGVSSALLSSLAQPGLQEQAAFLMQNDGRGRALSWEYAAEHLGDLQPLSPAKRLDLLVEGRLLEVAQDNLLVRVVASLPEHVLSAAVSSPVALGAGVGVSQAMGGSIVGALVAAMTTEATSTAAVAGFLASGGRASRLAGRWSDWVTQRAVGRVRKSTMISSRTPDTE